MKKKNVAELFDQLIQENPLHIQAHLLENQVTDDQNRKLNLVFKTLRGNLVKKISPIAWGGRVHEEIFQQYTTTLNDQINSQPTYHDSIENLNNLVEIYLNTCREQILATCAIQIAVEKLPFADIYLLMQPRISWPKNKPEKMALNFDGFTMAGELQGVVSKNVLYMKFKDKSPVFAPINGKFEFTHYDMPDPHISTFNQADLHYRFVDLIGHPILTNYAVHYIEQSQSQGQPFCNFLNNDNMVEDAMNLIHAPFENEEIDMDKAVLALIQRLKTSSTILIYNAVAPAYETILQTAAALCHLGAASYEFPGTRIIRKLTREALRHNLEINIPETIKFADEGEEIPNTAKMEYWSQKELDALARKRGIINLPEWTEEELEEMAIQRGIVKLPVWTEKELDELTKDRGLPPPDLPNWDMDPNLIICSKCGYALQPDWEECPICNTPLELSVKSTENTEEELGEQKLEEQDSNKQETEKEENNKKNSDEEEEWNPSEE
jgi:hypothetical protein